MMKKIQLFVVTFLITVLLNSVLVNNNINNVYAAKKEFDRDQIHKQLAQGDTINEAISSYSMKDVREDEVISELLEAHEEER